MRCVFAVVVPSAFALSLCLLLPWGLPACSSFAAAESPLLPDASDAATEGASSEAGTCAEPSLREPDAGADNRCGAGGGLVSLLDDNANCGACGHQCGASSAGCLDGTCAPEVLFDRASIVQAKVVGDNVYGVDSSRQVRHGVVGAKTLEAFAGAVFPAQTVVRRIDVDESYIYLSASSGPMRVQLDGALHEALPIVTTELGGIIALGKTSYFYAYSGGVERHSKASPVTGPVTVTEVGTTDVVADGEQAYWVSKKDGVASISGPFSNPHTLTSSPSIEAVALDSEHIYYVDRSVKQVRRVPRAGGPSQAIASELSNSIGTLALDGDYVYWSADHGSIDGVVVMRVAKCGGVPVALLKVQPNLGQISFDLKTVFISRLYTATRSEFLAFPK